MHRGKSSTALRVSGQCGSEFLQRNPHTVEFTLDFRIAFDHQKGGLGREAIEGETQAAHTRRERFDQRQQHTERSADGCTFGQRVGGELVEINEGCLSVPDMRGNVMRHVNVRVRWWDRDGAEHDEVRRGLTAGTFQHECDHLDGLLFLDRVHDTRSLTTWEQFERFHRAAFIERITEFVQRVGS